MPHSSGGGSSSGGTTIYPTSLTISGASTLYVGEETTLTASYQPNNITYKTVNWYTSDSAIATVTSAGKVKGKAAGPVVITAKLKSADGYLEATHNMTISVPSASSVSLNKTSVTLGFNKTVQLTATVNPIAANQAVTWSSNNNNVATVSNDGLVTSKAVVGNATITATTVDGGKTASCTVSRSLQCLRYTPVGVCRACQGMELHPQRKRQVVEQVGFSPPLPVLPSQPPRRTR